jgi:hypothetical protein
MPCLANLNVKLPHGLTYIPVTDASGEDSTVDVEEHDVVCSLSTFAELERIRLT